MKFDVTIAVKVCLEIHKENFIKSSLQNIKEYEERMKGKTKEQLEDILKGYVVAIMIVRYISKTIEDLEVPSWINNETFNTLLEEYEASLSKD